MKKMTTVVNSGIGLYDIVNRRSCNRSARKRR